MAEAGAGPDARLREAAANRGLKLVRSRRRKPGTGDYGRYGLTDAAGRELLGFGPDGLTATAEEVEAWLHRGLVSDWKTSLKTAGPAPKARAAKRAAPEPRAQPDPPRRPRSVPEPEPEPEPEPPEPELVIRDARPADAGAAAALVAELGFPASAADLRKRIAALARAGEPPLLAVRGEPVGLLTWHVTPVLHRPHPVGRITMMVVAPGERRSGVGRALVAAATERCAARGCGLIEVTSNVDLGPAHAFYRRLGFERTSYRFAMKLPAGT